ncbi:hypothetical protein LWI28_025767 [Acer negundo]|uniref:Uncharacterized protein n=1 Tax=Acer negundo TaxID=4023 RepID=A0AAD5IC00_ACENE|nr:hypothetical protein LWI28_025767 [Acer negundo]
MSKIVPKYHPSNIIYSVCSMDAYNISWVALDGKSVDIDSQSPESSLTCQFPADFISLFSVHGGRRRSSTIHPSRSPPRRRRCCLTSRCPPAPLF